jgi:alpha-ribazole phosphatase
VDATLYLIRHGEPEGAAAGRYLGACDVPLTGRGRRQMHEVAAALAGAGLRAVYCSDLARSVESAAIVAGLHRLEPVVVPALRERDFGAWEGLTWDEIQAHDPAGAERWARDPLAFRPVGGEDLCAVEERVVPAFAWVASGHPAGAYAIVAHGGVNRVLLARFFGLPRENLFRIAQDHAAVSVVAFHGGLPVVQALNASAGTLREVPR